MDVRHRLALAGAGTQGLATRPMLAREGVPPSALHRALVRGQVHRVRAGVYSNSPPPPVPRPLVDHLGPAPDHALIVRAALLGRGDVAARRRTAAALFGWGLLVEPRSVIELVAPHGRGRGAPTQPAGGGRDRLVQSRQCPVDVLDVVPGCDPMLVTTALRTAVDCLVELPAREAVVVVDSALRSGLTTLDEIRSAVQRSVRSGRARSLARLERCDPLAGSVLESVARLDLLAAGLGGFVTQRQASDRDGNLWFDFCWDEQRLVLEVDGARWHTDPPRDQARDNRSAALGMRVIRKTWSQVFADRRWSEQVGRALTCLR